MIGANDQSNQVGDDNADEANRSADRNRGAGGERRADKRSPLRTDDIQPSRFSALVAVYASQSDLRTQLERAKIPVYVYSHAGLADVFVTLQQVGERVGHARAAADLARSIQSRLDAIRRRVAGRARPRTLVVFDREALTLRGIYASGGVGFIHDMLGAAGGDNVFADVKQQSVQATTELILTRRPDAILELRGDPLTADMKLKEIGVWRALASLPAVRNSRVFFLDDQKTVVPGPRVAEGVDLIAHTLHPDAFK